MAAENPRELSQGEAVAAAARDNVLEPAGVDVHRVAVQHTPRYHGQNLTDMIILVLTLVGGLILLLGVFLVLNTVNALMAQQIRQIGVMKAVGGQQRQIAGLYLGLVLVFSAFALLVAIPLAMGGAWALSGVVGGMLNLELNGPWLPPGVLGIEVALGLIVPILAALVPVLRGTRVTVREAITSYGIGNVDFMDAEADVALGEVVTLKVDGTDVSWPVVGVVSSQLTGPVVYAPLEPLSQALRIPGEVNRVVLVATGDSVDARASVATGAEQALRHAGLPVEQVQTSDDLRGGTQSVFDLLVMLFLLAGALLVLVGGIGLAGAMSLNVIERRREIGVMRAIGASNRTIARLVITEGLTIGILSWVLGALAAVPLSWMLVRVIGTAFLKSPLSYSFSMAGVLLWLALVLVLSVVASLLPARGAWRTSVRETLAYE